MPVVITPTFHFHVVHATPSALNAFSHFTCSHFLSCPSQGTGLYNLCGGRTVSIRLLSSQPRLELQAGKKAGTPKQRRAETLYALAFCFGDESILPKTKPFITELDIHTNDRSQNKLKGYKGEGRDAAGSAAASHKQGELVNQHQHECTTDWLLLPFCLQESPLWPILNKHAEREFWGI